MRGKMERMIRGVQNQVWPGCLPAHRAVPGPTAYAYLPPLARLLACPPPGPPCMPTPCRCPHRHPLTNAPCIQVVAAIEEVDGCTFRQDAWTRPSGGGGITHVLQEGHVWEKAGVSVSVVYGTMSADSYRVAIGKDIPFQKVGRGGGVGWGRCRDGGEAPADEAATRVGWQQAGNRNRPAVAACCSALRLHTSHEIFPPADPRAMLPAVPPCAARRATACPSLLPAFRR